MNSRHASRDVLETRTEDVGDVGSTSVRREPKAATTRDRLDRDERGDGGGRDDVRRRRRPRTQPVAGRKGRECTVSSPAEGNKGNAVEAKAARRKVEHRFDGVAETILRSTYSSCI